MGKQYRKWRKTETDPLRSTELTYLHLEWPEQRERILKITHIKNERDGTTTDATALKRIVRRNR